MAGISALSTMKVSLPFNGLSKWKYEFWTTGIKFGKTIMGSNLQSSEKTAKPSSTDAKRARTWETIEKWGNPAEAVTWGNPL